MKHYCWGCDHEIERIGQEWVHKDHYPTDKTQIPSHNAGLFKERCYCGVAEERNEKNLELNKMKMGAGNKILYCPWCSKELKKKED